MTSEILIHKQVNNTEPAREFPDTHPDADADPEAATDLNITNQEEGLEENESTDHHGLEVIREIEELLELNGDDNQKLDSVIGEISIDDDGSLVSTEMICEKT